MTFNPIESGFEWPEKTPLINSNGEEMTVCPTSFCAGYEKADESVKECYRIYETDLGLLTEFEIKHWQAGGYEKEMELLDAYKQLFVQKKADTLPLKEVKQHLIRKGFDHIQICIILKWLIIGQYVRFDSKNMTISNYK